MAELKSRIPRPAAIVPWAAVLLSALVLAGCGGEADSAPAAPEAAAGGSGEVLAVQDAAASTLRRGDGGEYQLVMEEPSAETLYFTDSPGRATRTAPARRLPEWLASARRREGHTPNVSVSWSGRGPEPRSMVSRLAGAEYDRAADQLTFSLRPLRLPSGRPAATNGGAVATGARGPVTITIDGMGGFSCMAGVSTNWDLKLEHSELSHGEWNAAPPRTLGPEGAEIEASSDGLMTGCEFLTRYGDGEGNAVEVGVDVPFIGYPSYTCRGIGEIKCTVQEWDSGLLDVQA